MAQTQGPAPTHLIVGAGSHIHPSSPTASDRLPHWQRCLDHFLGLASALLLLGPTPRAQFPNKLEPELILYNGKIVTVDRRFSIQQAVAIGEKILAVGDSRSIQNLAGPGTRLIDLKGKTVIPGLMDDHYHMLSKAVDQYLGVEITLVGSIAEMLHAIKRKIEKTPPGEIVYTTSGWLPEQLKENRTPNRYDLDSVSPRNPVLVQGGHTYYLNSLALQLAGITKDTPSPAGGIIEKDPKTGEPTGLLVDNAMSLARKLIPLPSEEQKLRALRRALEKENSVGITGVREPGIRPADMRVYQELRERGELTVRVSMNLDLDPNQPAAILVRQLSEWGVSTFFGDHLLRLDGIGEFLIDGGFEGGLMTEPYEYPATMEGKPYFGLQIIPTAKFEEVLEAANRYNWRACIHTVGDRAADILLDAYETANREKPIARKRWVLEHGHYMRPNQFARIKKLGAVLSAQFHPYMAAQTMIHHWGRRRAEQSMRMRDWLDAGLTVGGGSDWSLVPANPFWMIYFWVTRNTRLWGVLGPEQRISREEALRVMTVNNAYLTFEEDVKGSIEPGKLADPVILSDDILTVPEEKIRDIKVLATFLGGKIVYEIENSPIRFQ